MADLTITATSVVPSSTAVTENGTAGAAITAGQAVYKDATTGKYLLADSNSATDAANRPRGIALHGAALNQPLQIAKSGPVTIGATLTAGDPYYLSDTPGGICPKADLATGEEVSQIGNATSTTVLDIDIQTTNVTLA